jgi:hypothetical protein
MYTVQLYSVKSRNPRGDIHQYYANFVREMFTDVLDIDIDIDIDIYNKKTSYGEVED